MPYVPHVFLVWLSIEEQLGVARQGLHWFDLEPLGVTIFLSQTSSLLD